MANGKQCQQSPRSLDFISDDEFEEALRRNKHFIVKNLNVMHLLINPVSFKDIISEDEQGKISSCHESGTKEKAAGMFIDAVLRSRDKTKWSVFKDALKRSKGLEVISDILFKGATEEARLHRDSEQAQIKLQRGFLADKWETAVVSNALLQEQMLTSQEYEEVTAKHRNLGDIAANHLMLSLVSQKKHFFTKLLRILWHLGYKKCAKEIDSDFPTKMAKDETSSYSNIQADQADNGNSMENATDFIGVNNMDYESNDKTKPENKIGCFNNLSITTQDDNEPIASRTRSKTKLKQTSDPDETLLKQPIVDCRLSGTSQKPMIPLPREQTLKQYPVFYSSPASTQCVQLDFPTINARLEVDKKQTNIPQTRDPEETYVKQPVIDCRPSSTITTPGENLPAEQAIIQYPVYYSSGENANFVQFNDAGCKATLQDDNNQKQSLELNDHNETVLMLPGASKKSLEALPVEPVVSPNALSHPRGAIRKCVKGKDVVEKARLQENNKETTHQVRLVACVCNKRFLSEDALREHKRIDCQGTLGHDYDKTSPLASRKNGAAVRRSPDIVCREYSGTKHERHEYLKRMEECDFETFEQTAKSPNVKTAARKPKFSTDNKKLSPATLSFKRCTCGRQFTSEETLETHRCFDCRDCQTVPEHTKSRYSNEPKYPLTETKSNQQEFGRPHINADTEKPRACEATGNKNGYFGAVKTSPARRTHGREISNEEKKTTLRSTQSDHQKPGTLVKAKSNTQSNGKTSGITEPDYRKQMRKCVCGTIFISEAYLKEHKRKDCPELSRLSNQTDEDEPYADTRQPYRESDLVLLEPNVQRARQESPDNSAHAVEVTNNVLHNTIDNNEQSDEETHQNNGAIESTQHTADTGGFGFQSSRTLQLHKKP